MAAIFLCGGQKGIIRGGWAILEHWTVDSDHPGQGPERALQGWFHRKGHQIWLSDTGRALYDITQGIFAQEEEAIELLRGSSEFESGVLRIAGGRDPGSWNRTRRGIRIHSRQTTSHRAGVECRYEKLSLRLLLKEKNTAPEDQCVSGPGRRGKFEEEGRLEGKGAGLKLNNAFIGFWKRGR